MSPKNSDGGITASAVRSIVKGLVPSIVIGLVVDWTLNAARATASVVELVSDQFQMAIGDAGEAIVSPFAGLASGFEWWLLEASIAAEEFGASLGPFAPFVGVAIVGGVTWGSLAVLTFVLNRITGAVK